MRKKKYIIETWKEKKTNLWVISCKNNERVICVTNSKKESELFKDLGEAMKLVIECSEKVQKENKR